MSCLPYPTFLQRPTQTSTTKSLSAAGRARIHPLTCPGRSSAGDDDKDSGSTAKTKSEAQAEYQAIISKCIEQSQVDDSDKSNKENAKLRKKYMKEGVAMASSYLTETLGLDVSIVDVEIVLNIDSIIETDGCLASCFLDAGCAYVVIRAKEEQEDTGGGLAKALTACDATRVPRGRLVLHCKSGISSEIVDQMGEISSRVGTVSVQITDPVSSTRVDWNDIPKLDDVKCVVQLSMSDKTSDEDLIKSVAALSKFIGENKGSITLVDPTAEQLGLCYAACMKTDRPDGLYTTVVCTRSNEALGLVYSSKVCNLILNRFDDVVDVIYTHASQISRHTKSVTIQRNPSLPPSNVAGVCTTPVPAMAYGVRGTRLGTTRPSTVLMLIVMEMHCDSLLPKMATISRHFVI